MKPLQIYTDFSRGIAEKVERSNDSAKIWNLRFLGEVMGENDSLHNERRVENDSTHDERASAAESAAQRMDQSRHFY